MAIGFPTHGLLCPFCFSFGHPWPICFLWASLALLLTMHSHGLLLISLDFPDLITLFSSLGFMGLSLTPYFLCLHYFGSAVAHSHFSISYTTHRYTISLFPGFLKPIYLLKAHLFISWACDPLFMPLGSNGFTTCLPTLCCPCGWAFFFLLRFSKMTLNSYYMLLWLPLWFWCFIVLFLVWDGGGWDVGGALMVAGSEGGLWVVVGVVSFLFLFCIFIYCWFF